MREENTQLNKMENGIENLHSNTDSAFNFHSYWNFASKLKDLLDLDYWIRTTRQDNMEIGKWEEKHLLIRYPKKAYPWLKHSKVKLSPF